MTAPTCARTNERNNLPNTRIKVVLVAAAATVALAAPAAHASTRLSISEARYQIRHLVIHKHKPHGSVYRDTIKVTSCVHRAVDRVRCDLEFSDDRGDDWSGKAWAKFDPRDPNTVISNYLVYS